MACQEAFNKDFQKKTDEQLRIIEGQQDPPGVNPPKGRYIKKGTFATYEPTGVRERNDAALRQLGVISWSYYVKDTAFSITNRIKTIDIVLMFSLHSIQHSVDDCFYYII